MADPAYDSEEIARVFGRAAPAYDSVVPFFTRFGARLVETADLRPGERVLDLHARRPRGVAAAGLRGNGPYP